MAASSPMASITPNCVSGMNTPRFDTASKAEDGGAAGGEFMDLTLAVANKYYIGSTSSVFRMSLLKKCAITVAFAVMVAISALRGLYHCAHIPIDLASRELDVTIKSHSTLRSVSAQLIQGGVNVQPELFVLMTR